MTTRRTFARSAAVLGAATALTVAGAGAAMATTHTSEVDGNDVSVTFELESGEVLDGCAAVITQTADAAGVAAQLSEALENADLLAILDTLEGNDAVTILKTDGLILDSPVADLNLITPSKTVSAEGLPSNIYALVSVCGSDPSSPTINPMLMVGDPMEAIMGSVQSGSDADLLGTASAMLQGGDESGLGAILSSALGGAEGEGSPLDALSSGMGDGESVPE